MSQRAFFTDKKAQDLGTNKMLLLVLGIIVLAAAIGSLYYLLRTPTQNVGEFTEECTVLLGRECACERPPNYECGSPVSAIENSKYCKTFCESITDPQYAGKNRDVCCKLSNSELTARSQEILGVG